MTVLTAMTVSCSQEPILPSSQVNEEYTKNFIKEFGIPAQGHDFAMATSAGLKVKTVTGGHVTVTAEVDGKEYLFADLNVPAGTHALPVTIPNSVTTLKVKSGFKTFEAGVNDLVDIDADAPASRSWIISGDNYDTEGYEHISTINGDGIDAPLIAFRPTDFLAGYFKEHAVGAANSTDYFYQGCNVGDGYALPYSEPNYHLFFGETALGGYGEYIVFPVWWRKNDMDSKKYTLKIHDVYNYEMSVTAPFNDPDNVSNPFPELKYYTGDASKFMYDNENIIEYGVDNYGSPKQQCRLENGDIVFDKIYANLNDFITSTGDNAYPVDETTMVISRGHRIKFTYDPGKAHDFGVAFCLDDGNGNYSYSMPEWNKENWGNNYFDEDLNHLFFSYVSTMQYPLNELNTSEAVKLHIWEKRSMTDEKPFRLFFNYTPVDDIYHDRGDWNKNGAFIVGFSSPAQSPADVSTHRDYTDFLMLVVPMGYIDLLYQGGELPGPYVWTMAVEDLGGTDDWDFNDVVFHFTDVIGDLNSVNMNNLFTSVEGPADAERARVITVWPEATGGTMPIYITFTGEKVAGIEMPRWGADKMYHALNEGIKKSLKNVDDGTFVVGTEVHKWLGASHYTQFVNVGDKRNGTSGTPVQFTIPIGTVLNYAEDTTYKSEDNTPLYGFALLVDKENRLGIDAMNVEEKGMRLLPDLDSYDGAYVLIGAPNEKGSVAPQMLLISDGDGSWQWPSERKKISDAYSGFNDWISDKGNTDWHTNPNTEYVTKK